MPAKHDWSRLDAMSEAQKRSAAMNDPDNPPLSETPVTRRSKKPAFRGH
jgi:hypothetical protein